MQERLRSTLYGDLWRTLQTIGRIMFFVHATLRTAGLAALFVSDEVFIGCDAVGENVVGDN